MGDAAITGPGERELETIDEAAQAVKALLDAGDRPGAMRRAMAVADALLQTPTDALRVTLRTKVFKNFFGRGVSYQDKDFECVDYEQYEIAPDLPLFRGPPVPPEALERGDYFCVIGAAQTLGRLALRPWPTLVSEATGLPVLNLSRGGAGPEAYLHPTLLELANRAKFVILQVMSGRSVGCDEYPGEVLVTREGVSTGVHRLELLRQFWREDPNKAFHYATKWNNSYFELYSQMRAAIRKPTLLLWISDRTPEGWRPKVLLTHPKTGSFPHLVGNELFQRTASLFDAQFKYLTGPISEKTISRLTGEPCPYFGDSGNKLHREQIYYPTAANHAQLAQRLTDWLETVV